MRTSLTAFWPLLSLGCGWFGVDDPVRTRCHEAGRIPFVDLTPHGARSNRDIIHIRGSVPEVEEGQVRFHEEVDGSLTLICLDVVCDGAFDVLAPASAEAPVYISVTSLGDGEPIEGSHLWGAREAPVTLAGEDIDVQLQLGQRAAWTEGLLPALDQIAQTSDVTNRVEPPPP
jgi:hypothetical protein